MDTPRVDPVFYRKVYAELKTLKLEDLSKLQADLRCFLKRLVKLTKVTPKNVNHDKKRRVAALSFALLSACSPVHFSEVSEVTPDHPGIQIAFEDETLDWEEM